MKFLSPKPGQFMDLFRMLAQQESYTFSDPESAEKFVNRLAEEFRSAKSNPVMSHGFRVQAMFEFVAASLGKCAVIKTEDAGGLHTQDSEIKVPDLRIVLTDGREFFVEVKNFYQSDPFEGYRIKRGYLDGLRRYAALFKRDVKLAIHWSRWNLWTLVSPDRIKCEGNKCSLSLVEALKYSEMATLGDYRVATLPPLRFRFSTDPSRPRSVSEHGEASFTISGVELYCRDNQITVPQEQNIALFLMLYGDWPSERTEARIENGELIHFDFISEPIEAHPDHEFQMIGSFSGMVSRRFNELTTREGAIERLSPQTNISNIGVDIPSDYKGEGLPLWRFSLVPPLE